jgi:hypothetical protein
MIPHMKLTRAIRVTIVAALATAAVSTASGADATATTSSATHIKINHSLTRLGSSAVISGSVSPNLHGHVVYLQTHSHSKWITLRHYVLSGASRFTFTVLPHSVGTLSFRVWDPPTGHVAQSFSPTVSLTILACTARMSNPAPVQYSTTHVIIATGPSAAVRATAHYRTTTTTHSGHANSAGRADIPFRISGATHGYRVVVGVHIQWGQVGGTCSTSFTTR